MIAHHNPIASITETENNPSVLVCTTANLCSPTYVHNPAHSLKSDFPTDDNTGPFIGAGVGVGLCLLLVALALVAIIILVVLVKSRAANNQTGGIKMTANPCYNNQVEEEDVGGEYDNTVNNKENGSVADGFDPYEDVDSKAQSRTARTPPQKVSSSPASATNVGELYAVVNKSKKKGAKKKGEENGCIETNKDDLYTVPVKKDKMTDEGMVATGRAEKSEDYDDVAELKYEPKADSEPGQQSEGDENTSNVLRSCG